jgi:hypothetical protein
MEFRRVRVIGKASNTAAKMSRINWLIDLLLQGSRDKKPCFTPDDP